MFLLRENVQNRDCEMAKGKTVFFCKECGYETSKWMGQCPGCRQWNTLVEERVTRSSEKKSLRGTSAPRVTGIFQVSMEKEDRISSGMPELDRVLYTFNDQEENPRVREAAVMVKSAVASPPS